MKDWKKEVLDSPEMWPDSHIIQLEEPFQDDRGVEAAGIGENDFLGGGHCGTPF